MSEQVEQAQEAESEKPRLARMSEDELRKFVLDYCDGKLLMGCQVPTNMLRSVFMVLALAEPEWLDGIKEDFGDIYEYYSAAGPMAVNGYPTFFSVRVLHKLDLERVVPAVNEELARRKNIKV